MTDSYVPGDLPHLTAAFTVDGVATDPTTVTLVVEAPDGTTVTYLYGTDAIPVREGTGLYSADVPALAVGRWEYRWSGTGTAAGASEGSFAIGTEIGRPPSWTYDLATATGQVRLMIDDRDLSAVGAGTRPRKRSAIFSDEEIAVFLDDARAGGSPTVAAALALIVVSGNRQLLVQSRRIGDTVVDFGRVREDLLKQAAALVGGQHQLELLTSPAPADAIVSHTWTDFAYREILIDAAVRSGGG